MPIVAHVDWLQKTPGELDRRLLSGAEPPKLVVSSERASLGFVANGGPGAPIAATEFAGQLGNVYLAADGRIDNLDELRQAVGADRAAQAGELLIEAYFKWGPAFPEQLAGDFALVLWDLSQDRLLACRDPFGVRPLFYRASSNGISVTSRIEQILHTLAPRPRLDDQMVVEHLLWRYKANDATFFREIRQVRPGHVLIANGSGMRLERYWFPPAGQASAKGLSRDDYQAEFQRLFSQSIKRRLTSISPVMIHVSGGLDSSAIAVVADRVVRSAGLPSVSLRGVAGLHPGLPCDEQTFIEAVARRIEFPIEYWDATDVDPEDLPEPSIEAPGGLPMIGGTKGDLSIALRQRATVILSGIGGDQLMTPVGVTQDMLASHDWAGAIRILLFFENATLASRLGRLRSLAAQSSPVSLRRIVRKMRAEVPNWLSPELGPLARELALPERSDVGFSSWMQRHIWNKLESQNIVRAIDAFQRPAGRLGVEYRFPYLDRDLVRFVLTIPYQRWPHPGPFARMHRSFLRDALPREIAGRVGKAEFTPALTSRIRHWKTLIETLLYEGSWASDGYVNRKTVQRLWTRVTQDSKSLETLDWRRVWAIVTLETWLRRI